MDAQGSQTNAKEDTRYLGLTTLATDLSQYGTDLTASGSAAYESASARTAITGASGREIYVRCTLTAAEASRTLICHGDDAYSDRTFEIRTSAAGKLELAQNSTTVWTSAATVPAGDCSIAWSTRANPDATGTSDALISEVVIYDHTAGAYVTIEQFTHAVPTTDAGWTLAIGGAWKAAIIGSPTNAVTKARVSASFHNHVEFAQDWVAARSAHVTSLVTPREPIGASLAALGGVAEWAGQANVGFLGAHANALRGRMLSPLINEVYSRARTITSTPSPTQWIANAPGSSVFKADVTTLRWLPVPGVDYAFVRVHVTSWVTSGDPVPIAVRLYSLNRPHLGLGPTLGGQPKPPLVYTFAEASLTENHTSTGMGEWLDLGLVKLSPMVEPIPGWTGTTTLCLAYAFDPDGESTNDANARLRINALQVRPVIGEP